MQSHSYIHTFIHSTTRRRSLVVKWKRLITVQKKTLVRWPAKKADKTQKTTQPTNAHPHPVNFGS